eukprot:4013580-Lingulodinium_polyedra.AAC.1
MASSSLPSSKSASPQARGPGAPHARASAPQLVGGSPSGGSNVTDGGSVAKWLRSTSRKYLTRQSVCCA